MKTAQFWMVGLGAMLIGGTVLAGPIEPLTPAKRPLAVGTGGLIADQLAVEQLGKALFWDVNVGSNGVACASCHYAAGADIRTGNMINPGPDHSFGAAPNGASFGPAAVVTAKMFPFHRLQDKLDRQSAVTFDSDNIMASSGTFAATFNSVTAGKNGQPGVEDCTPVMPAEGAAMRQQTFRHAPTVINAAYDLRLFGDGNANSQFNAIDPLGPRTLAHVPNAGIILSEPSTGLSLKKIALSADALASQSMGPPANGIEMSCAGRTLRDIGRKLLGAKALSTQYANPTDSLFAEGTNLVAASGPGLKLTYAQMVKRAFVASSWSAKGRFSVALDGTILADPAGQTQAEYNFPLFFGLAIQAYERRLISEKTPYDAGFLNASARRGEEVFIGKGKCNACHDGPLFTSAAYVAGRPVNRIDRVQQADGTVVMVDKGFFNIGVRPTSEDLGVGDTDPFLMPLSFSQQYIRKLQGLAVSDKFAVLPCSFRVPFSKDILGGGACSQVPSAAQAATLKVAVDGAHKVPTLRNIALTPPYMHNGGFSNLEQVVDFYNRGGDARATADCGGKADTSGKDGNCSNLVREIAPLGLTDQEKADLVAFLKSLTDNRVACQSGPFDHPSLPLNLGHDTATDADGRLVDVKLLLPAVGTWGLPGVGKPCFPNSGSLFGTMQTAFTKILNPLDRP